MADTRVLNTIFRKGASFGTGAFGGTLLQLVFGIWLIRLIDPEDLGFISTCLTIIGICLSVGHFGFMLGIPRMTAKGEKTTGKRYLGRIVGTSTGILLLSSTGIVLLLLFAANGLSRLWSRPELAGYLKMVVFILPAMLLKNNLLAVCRGIQITRIKIIFQDLLLNIIKIAVLFLLSFFSIDAFHILGLHLVSEWLVVLLLFGYFVKNDIGIKSIEFNAILGKKLLVFSFPLLGVELLTLITKWIPILTIGWFHDIREIGYYNAPFRIMMALELPLQAMAFIYLPAVTLLFESDRRPAVNDLYKSVTKWIVILSLPISCIFILDAPFVTTWLFGEKYALSAPLLRIIAIGYTIHNLLGLNGTTMIAAGDTKITFRATALGVVTGVLLCFLLIPAFKAMGAAIAISAATTITNVYISWYLYIRYRIHPFDAHYLKPAMVIVGISCFLLMSPCGYFFLSVPSKLMIYGTIAFLSFGSLFFTRSISSEDMALLKGIEKRMHGNTVFMDKLCQFSKAR